MLRASVRPSRLRQVTALACGAAAVLAVLVAAPAQAATPTPVTPVFPSTIDPYGYDKEDTCDPTAKPGAVEVVRLLQRTYGTSLATNIPRACSGTGTSGHHSGRAIDWMTNSRVPAQKAMGDAFVTWLLATDKYGNKHANGRRLGVQYVIWNSRMFPLYGSNPQWKEYNGCLTSRTSAADDNYCHRNHVHTSLSWNGAYKRTSWYTWAGMSRLACPTPATPARWTAPAARGLGLVPLVPARLFDSRSGDAVAGGCYLAPQARYDVQVTGRGGVPASGVAAVVLNVVSVDPDRATFLAAYPAGSTAPSTSSVNALPGESTAASVVVPVGTGGKVSVLNGTGASDLVVDVTGYFPSDGSGARYQPAPAAVRALDERVERGSWSAVTAGLPSGTTAVVTNVVLDGSSTAGYGSVTPRPLAHAPATSALNVQGGKVATNRVITQVESGGAAIYTSTNTRAVVDVTGWFGGSGASYYPLAPQRLVDTRSGTGADRLSGGEQTVLTLTGAAGVPAGVTAVAVTMTLTGSERATHATVWKQGRPQPATSDLNIVPGDSKANLVLAPVDSSGRVLIELDRGSADLVVDVLGYYR